MVTHYLKLLRPQSWIKNILIFVPIFFAKSIFVPHAFKSVTLAFIAFCLLASSVYIFNDILDLEADRAHSHKKNRPLPSSKVSVKQAIVIQILIFLAAAGLIYFYLPTAAPLFLAYVVLNVIYSLYLKHTAVLGIICVAIFYLLRVAVGGQAAGVPVSEWLVLCTFFLALFLIVGKRKAEYRQESQRKVLASYTPEFLNGILIASVTLSIISFSLYTILAVHSTWAVYSVVLVVLSVFRYLLLIYKDTHEELPEVAIFRDPVVLLGILGWIVVMFKVFYS